MLHGARSYLLQDEDGQTIESHSISAGLDYPGVGPGARVARRQRPRAVPADHRRAGDGRVQAAVPHRGHHPGDRERARPGGCPGHRPTSSGPTPSCWSVSPAAATRTSTPRPSGSDSWTVSGQADRVAAAYELAAKEERAALVGLPARRLPDQGRRDRARSAPWWTRACDIVEVGLPYSDPVLDGPTIQEAADIALRGGIRITDVLATVEAVAATGVATVVMTYWNPVAAVRRGPLRPRPRRGRRLRPDHARPDPRRGRRVDRGRHRRRPRPDLPGRAVHQRRAAGLDGRRLPRLRLRHVRHGGDRRPRPPPAASPRR